MRLAINLKLVGITQRLKDIKTYKSKIILNPAKISELIMLEDAENTLKLDLKLAENRLLASIKS